jgi:hypothetical protein
MSSRKTSAASAEAGAGIHNPSEVGSPSHAPAEQKGSQELPGCSEAPGETPHPKTGGQGAVRAPKTGHPGQADASGGSVGPGSLGAAPSRGLAETVSSSPRERGADLGEREKTPIRDVDDTRVDEDEEAASEEGKGLLQSKSVLLSFGSSSDNNFLSDMCIIDTCIVDAKVTDNGTVVLGS